MSAEKEPDALAHIEKTLTDSYRKEIDQEENIWRSLPFFAATLALQLAALFQTIERLPAGHSWFSVLSHSMLLLSVLSSFGALCLLAWSIFPAKFVYVAKDSDLLRYALDLIEDENAPDGRGGPVAVHILKKALATQYALATDNNRQINKRRERRRSIAGLLTILSVVSTLMLVAATLATYVPNHQEGAIDGRQSRASQPSSEAVQSK